MRTSARISTVLIVVALPAAMAVGTADAQAQRYSNVIPGNNGPPPPPQNGPPVPWLDDAFNAAKWVTQIFTGPPDNTIITTSPSGDTVIIGPIPTGDSGNTSTGPTGPQAGPVPSGDDTNVYRPSTAPYSPGGHLGGPVGMTIYGNSPDYGGIEVSNSHSNGYRVSDTAGLITNPNALTPGYRSWSSGGGIGLTYDASRAVGGNQRLWFGLSGDFQNANASFSSSALTPGGANANVASTRGNIATIKGSANYDVNNVYLSAVAAGDFNHVDITNNFSIPGTIGNTNGRGYTAGVNVGEWFSLYNTIAANPAGMAVKAPPRTAGGSALLLDLSGHYLYRHVEEDGFTDTTGFTFGTQKMSFSDVGGRARLLAVVPDRGFAWMPYVGVTYDRTLGVRETLGIPAQAVTPADTFIVSPANDIWGAEAGLDLINARSTKFGIKAYYAASNDTRTIGGSAYLRIPFWDFGAASADSGIRIAPRGNMPVKAPPLTPPATWSWAGLYLGGHVGGGLSLTTFADPFGKSIYGDRVRSPAFLGGGQIGYNWQAPGSRWVFGVEADASAMDSDGDVTCFAASPKIVTSTCRVRPQATGTFTGRVGYALGPDGRTLVYGKGGLAWAHDNIDMALNAAGFGLVRAVAPATLNSQSATFWGGTVGIGVERAVTPAWSVKAEYDFADFGSRNVANLGNVAFLPVAPFTITTTAPGTSGASQTIHEMKVGLNYKWGADPWAPAWTATPTLYRKAVAATGWEVEGGGRYFGSWGRFQKDFGLTKTLGLPPISDLSRLTYDSMQTHSGEFFGRVDTPWNLFVKGYVGGGSTDQGHMNDEDTILVLPGAVGAYVNTLSPAVTGNIRYGVIDGGYDFLRGPGYKVGVFAGYFGFDQKMNAFGCAAISSVNCAPNPVPTSGSPVVTENDRWTAARVGVSAETMVTDRVKISGEAAWLPRVWFSGVDNHFVGNTGVLAEIIPSSGKGSGVQLEALASYYITPQWDVGLGARYWGMWTTPTGQLNFTFPGPPTPFQNFRAQVEQFGVFAQTSYKFNLGNIVAALH